VFHHLLIETEKDVNSWGLDVCVNDANSISMTGDYSRQVSC
jgi:hypothetical protein